MLPLAALGLLSTLFLLSSTVDPTNSIPISQSDLQERARDRQITAPTFAGASADGALIAFTAAAARPDPEFEGRVVAETPSAIIDLVGGTRITFRGETGELNERLDRAILTGDVKITSSLGYVVTSDKLISAMQEVRAQSPGPVSAIGPVGTFDAGQMTLSTNPETGHSHLLFTNGVHLIYDPKT